MSQNNLPPTKHEPEVARAKARKYASQCNAISALPRKKEIDQAMRLAERAYEIFDLPHKPGLREYAKYPASRFTWFCDETGDATRCVRIRDNQTGKVADWRYWRG